MNYELESLVNFMSKIVYVGTVGGEMLDVQLEGGGTLLLPVKKLLCDPRFAALSEDDRILYPKTDGNAVFWRDGERISLPELLELMKNNQN